MKILVATDLSERSDRAVRRAVRLARQLKADLRVLHVVDRDLPERIAREIRQNVPEEIRGRIAALDPEPLAAPEIDVVTGHGWDRIVEAAGDGATDLVLLGAHRSRGFADLFQGTTLHRVARAIDIPLLVVTREATQDYRTVLVATDFSASATAATREAARLAGACAITHVHAYQIPFKGLVLRSEGDGDIVGWQRRHAEDGARRAFDAWAHGLPEPARTAKLILREGSPAAVIEAAVHERQADLLALGQHARSGLVQAFLGSTARALMTDPPTDLLLMPPRRTAGAAAPDPAPDRPD